MRMNWAHALTIMRFVLIFPITVLLMQGFHSWSMAVYILAAVTDFFDGRIARMQGTASEFGARLDAGADVAFSIMIFAWLFLLYPESIAFLLGIFAFVAIAFAITAAVSFAIAKRIVSLHLQVGRVGTFLLFAVFPVIVLFGHLVLLISIAAAVVVAGRIETMWELKKKESLGELSE